MVCKKCFWPIYLCTCKSVGDKPIKVIPVSKKNKKIAKKMESFINYVLKREVK